MACNVFVEGATDATPAGVARLADAIAKHYGLPAADLLARLQKGRFRVKGNIDRELADKYRRDLEILGARCVIEEANAQVPQRPTPIPFPSVRPATPPAGTPQYQSGLSAAFSPDTAAASLGALEKDSMSFALSSVDGADEQAPSASAFEPPASALPASIGPAPEKPKPAKPSKADRPKDVPLDLFAPPDAEEAELQVDIAADELDTSAKKRASAAAPAEVAAPPSRSSSPQLPARASQPAIQQPASRAEVIAPPSGDRAPAREHTDRGLLGDMRVRLAAGVLLAILIGFVPAHLVASAKESAADKTIDSKVMATQQLADTPEAYAALDRMRADQLARKKGEHRNAAIIGFAIWALVGGGVAFGWFKKIPWDRFD